MTIKTNYNTLGEFLHETRTNKLLLTQEEISQDIGITRVYYGQIERNQMTSLSTRTIKKIAYVFRVSPKSIVELLNKGK